MLLWLSLLFKRRRSSPHNVESAGRLTCAFYNLQLFQKKKVYVVKLIASNTIEEKVLELQRRKEAIIAATVSTSDTAIVERLSTEDLASLLS